MNMGFLAEAGSISPRGASIPPGCLSSHASSACRVSDGNGTYRNFIPLPERTVIFPWRLPISMSVIFNAASRQAGGQPRKEAGIRILRPLPTRGIL